MPRQLEVNGATSLGGIGQMRTVKQVRQFLEVAKNEAAIKIFEGMRVEDVRIRCHAEHYAFYSGPIDRFSEQTIRHAQRSDSTSLPNNDMRMMTPSEVVQSKGNRGGNSSFEGGHI